MFGLKSAGFRWTGSLPRGSGGHLCDAAPLAPGRVARTATEAIVAASARPHPIRLRLVAPRLITTPLVAIAHRSFSRGPTTGPL
jgi:hypothetical protein